MMGMRMGLGLGAGQSAGEGLDTATIAYIAAMANKPTSAQQTAINSRIVAIKAQAGLWDKLLALYFFDIHDATAALINVINPGTYNCTANAAPTFNAYNGYAFVASRTTQYLNSNINPSTNASLTLDSISLGIWITNFSTHTATTYIMGHWLSADLCNALRVEPTTGIIHAGVQTTKAGRHSLGAITGHVVVTRVDGNDNMDAYNNGTRIVQVPPFPKDSAKIAIEENASIYIGSCNGAPVPANATTKIAHIGTNLVATDVSVIYNAINSNPITA